MKARSAVCGLYYALGLHEDVGAWVSGDVYGCAYPRTNRALARLATERVSVLVNLHERAHEAARLARYGLLEVHVPVRHFTAPTFKQLEIGVAAVEGALAAGWRVAIHCGGGRGRTGTLLACYLVRLGLDADAAIAHVRSARTGAVETRAQRAAVHGYQTRLRRATLRNSTLRDVSRPSTAELLVVSPESVIV